METQLMPAHIELGEDEFDAKYQPKDVTGGDNGEMTWEFGEVKEAIRLGQIKLKQVWSLVDGDDGSAYALPGFHVVNVFGYCVTEVPWEHENITGLWIDETQKEN